MFCSTSKDTNSYQYEVVSECVLYINETLNMLQFKTLHLLFVIIVSPKR